MMYLINLLYPMPEIPYPSVFDFTIIMTFLYPLIVIAFLLVLILASYKYFRYLLLILLIWFFCLFVWVNFLVAGVLPFSPVIENCFFLISTLILFLTIFSAYSFQKK